MDLFGRKARAELAIWVAMYGETFTQRNLALDAWKAERAINEAARLIVSQRDTRIAALQAQIAELRKELETAVQPKAVPPISSAPLYLNEQEEDIEYAFKNELIDKETYEDMLAQLQFDNTEITFDYS